jgi:Zn-dependent membrane protease YugP
MSRTPSALPESAWLPPDCPAEYQKQQITTEITRTHLIGHALQKKEQACLIANATQLNEVTLEAPQLIMLLALLHTALKKTVPVLPCLCLGDTASRVCSTNA